MCVLLANAKLYIVSIANASHGLACTSCPSPLHLSEALAYSCYLKLMATQRELFPPEVGMNTRMTNLRELLEVGGREGGREGWKS